MHSNEVPTKDRAAIMQLILDSFEEVGIDCPVCQAEELVQMAESIAEAAEMAEVHSIGMAVVAGLSETLH